AEILSRFRDRCAASGISSSYSKCDEMSCILRSGSCKSCELIQFMFSSSAFASFSISLSLRYFCSSCVILIKLICRCKPFAYATAVSSSGCSQGLLVQFTISFHNSKEFLGDNPFLSRMIDLFGSPAQFTSVLVSDLYQMIQFLPSISRE